MFSKAAGAVLKSTDAIPLSLIAVLAVAAVVLSLVAITSHGMLDASEFMNSMVGALNT